MNDIERETTAARTADLKALAREIHHQNALVPEDVAAAVLNYFCKAAVEKMSEGFAVQLDAENGDFVEARKQGSAVSYCWMIWKKGYKGKTIVDWI
jgi:hypothetical protein